MSGNMLPGKKEAFKLLFWVVKTAVTVLPPDVELLLRRAYEEGDGKEHLSVILENVELARKEELPICQDTGVPVFFVKLPSGFLPSWLYEVLTEVVEEATREGYLRPNMVTPLSRVNVKVNTGLGSPIIHVKPTRQGYLEVAFMPKGAGCENVSKAQVLTPLNPFKGILRYVLEVTAEGGSYACPPLFVGVGVGGTLEQAALLAKEALVERVDVKSCGEEGALEEKLYSLLNSLRIGVMGLGAGKTVLAVKAKLALTHTASLPVCVNVQCWALRKCVVRVYPDGPIEPVSHPDLRGELKRWLSTS